MPRLLAFRFVVVAIVVVVVVVVFLVAVIAVWAMAASLEFAKFVLAAYLHQTWKQQNLVFKSYLSFAIVVLSIITSVGIYGFLSDAYCLVAFLGTASMSSSVNSRHFISAFL